MQNPSRRRLVAAGLAGAVSAVSGRQVAAGSVPEPSEPTESSTESTTEATEATEPPKRPTAADVELLGFAQGLERTAHDLFAAAIDAGAAGDTDRVLLVCREIHQAHIDAYSAMLGTNARDQRDDALFEEWSASFDVAALEEVAAGAYDFESVAAATHIDMLGQLENLDAVRLAAAVAMTDSRLCAVFADMSGRGDDFNTMFDNGADALSPSAASGG